MADAVADRLGDGLGLLVDLLEHERLEARLSPRPRRPSRARPARARRGFHPRAGTSAPSGRSATISPSPGNCTVRVSRRNAAAFEARNISPEPDPDDERHLVARADEEAGVVVVDHDEREVPLELVEREPDGLDEVALVVALDEVRDGLGVGLGRERVAVGRRGSP